MLKLLVLVFANETGAQEMITNVQALQRQQLITVSDAAYVIRQKDGKIKVKQANSLVGSGALGGAFWGLLIGRHFWLPWLTPRTEAVAEVAVEERDCGIDKNFLREVGCVIEPGYSALFILVAYITDEIFANLAMQSNKLLYTDLSGESDTKMREAFGIVAEV